MLKNNLINLNVHSYYSLLSSSLSIDKIISFAISNNQEYVCMVDKNVMYGAFEFYKKAKISTRCYLQKSVEKCMKYKNCKDCIKQYFETKVKNVESKR